MDIVLEVFDQVLFDRAYAALLPARPAPYDYPNHLVAAANASAAAQPQTFSAWEYKPATAWFSLQPSQYAYQSAWSRDYVWRQFTSLYLITWIFGLVVYFVFATLSYFLVFDHEVMKHPKFLKNQVWLEIVQANWAMPGMAALTAPIFLAEVRGYTKLYDLSAEGPGRWYDWFQFPLFLLWTDFGVYWIHRGLHHPLVYKTLHKPHHKWIVSTPFASHAFHFVDGWAQSVPYHVFPFVFPLQKVASVALFILINMWTISIHDGEFVSNNAVINGSACHSIHHIAFNYNYGQYFTLWDRIGGSYRAPDHAMFERARKQSQKEWEKQARLTDEMVVEVEGGDDRTYGDEAEDKKRR